MLALWFCLGAVMPAAGDPAHVSHGDSGHHQQEGQPHPHHPRTSSPGWEGSVQGIAYSEFNHHLAGLFVLLIGLSELRQAMRWPSRAWTRFPLPAAMFLAGGFLLIWSDHDAWPVGSLSFSETFWGQDPEILQHKIYGLLCLFVGAVELLKRTGYLGHAAWTMPLPMFAIVGGMMLFGHSHGNYPAAHKIALHHAIMGTLAITAGSSRLLSGWQAKLHSQEERSFWELLWAALILVIGLQLLVYAE
jgi:putative copper resistance protein D